jgi:DNA-directed RNA polymerase subunit RPC12/RpoP
MKTSKCKDCSEPFQASDRSKALYCRRCRKVRMSKSGPTDTLDMTPGQVDAYLEDCVQREHAMPWER